MAQKKFQAVAELFVDISKADSDFDKFSKTLKQKMAGIATAADKMNVFKDLVGYIGQVDKALGLLKAKNADAFSHMFDGLDVNLKQVTEMLLGVSNIEMDRLDAVREKINAILLSGEKTGHGKAFKEIAEDLNYLYRSIGASEDKLLDVKSFGGKGKFELAGFCNQCL